MVHLAQTNFSMNLIQRTFFIFMMALAALLPNTTQAAESLNAA